MRVSDVANNSQASLIAQQQAMAGQQQAAQNAGAQFGVEAQRAIDRMMEQVPNAQQLAERDRIREENRRREREGSAGSQSPESGQQNQTTPKLPKRPRVSDGERGRYIDIEA